MIFFFLKRRRDKVKCMPARGWMTGKAESVGGIIPDLTFKKQPRKLQGSNSDPGARQLPTIWP